jgi:superfamily II DNA or RNA helicase
VRGAAGYVLLDHPPGAGRAVDGADHQHAGVPAAPEAAAAAEGRRVTIKLRPYQVEAVTAAHRAHAQGVRRPAEVLATGAGKSVILAEVARTSAHGVAGGKRVVVLAHREELVQQNAQKVRDVAPDLRVGIVQAGMNQVAAHVISASVQTLASPGRRAQLRDVGLVIVDECHHAPARTYVDVLDHFGCMAPGALTGSPFAVALGFTATMVRGDGKALGDIWQDVVYVKDTAELIADGYLVRPVGVRVRVDDLQLGKVRKVAGDYSSKGLGDAIEDSMAPKKIVEALREHAPDRQTLLFAPLVHTAEVIRDALRAGGFTAELVHGGTPPEERRRLLLAYRDGKVQVLCNAMVFTEGTDLPMTGCVVIARPTMNPGLFIQMVGRGLRLWPGKHDCVVLDVVGATNRHRLSAQVELFGEESYDREDVESLTDAQLEDELGDEIEQAKIDDLLGLDAPQYRDGALVHEIVDLFEGSDAGWLRTYAGVWFLATAQQYAAVLPRVEGGYGVVLMDRVRAGSSAWVIERVSELGYAMAHAEGAVEGLARDGWGDGPKSKNYVARRALGMGLTVTPDMSAGEIKKMITVGLASARIDAVLPPWVRR